MPQEYICTDVGLTQGDTTYINADKIDVDALLQRQEWNDRLVKQLVEQRRIAPLTAESFRINITRRPADAPWPPRGFTEAYLVESGLLDKAAVAEVKKEAEASKKAAKPRIISVKLTEEKIPVGVCYIQPKKVGNFTQYDVTDAEGTLLRDKAFRDVDKARAFLEDLSPVDPATGTPVADSAEQSDDGDLRPLPE